MCKSKRSTDVIEAKSSRTTNSSQPSRQRSSDNYDSQRSSSDPSTSGNNNNNNFNFMTGSSYKDSWKSSVSSRTSLSSLRESLPEIAHIYEFFEIRSATNNFTAKRFSSSSSSAAWRCAIRGKDAIVFQRKLRRPANNTTEELREQLSLICKSHHSSLVKLNGASISGNYIYLVYDYIQGANLADCLRNPKNPNFTVLSNWMSRMQIATDIAHGIDYIHHCTGLNLSFVHNHIKSSSIILTEPSLNAKICHFGTSQLCGEITKIEIDDDDKKSESESPNLKRLGSRKMKFEGTRGYMSPEFQSNGIATQKSDVYAFGVVVLELLSGDEPLKYKFDDDGGYLRISVIDTAREAADGGGDGDGGGGGGGGLRMWVDKRLKDSYPVDIAHKLTRVGLDCVEDDPNKRPDMGWVTGRVSKLYLDSKNWAENIGVPIDFSVSFAPR